MPNLNQAILHKTSMTKARNELEQAFKSTEHRLRAYLRKRLPHECHVDDVLQDVMLKALDSEDKGRTIGNLSAWLHTATRNALVDYYRARKPLESLDENMPEPLEEDLERHRELAACIAPMLEKLPALYRDTLYALEIEGKKQRELASLEGVSVSAIKSRASRGRKILKQQLLDCCHISVENGLVSDFHRRDRCI